MTATASTTPARAHRPPPSGTRRQSAGATRDVAIVAGPACLAAMLSLFDLSARSLGFDEAASVTIAAQHGHALGSAIAHDGGNMSGYYVLLHGVTALFGHALLAIRLPSVIATVATVTLVGLLGLRLFDRRVALIAGLLTAVSLPLVFWGQSARGYAPMVALVTASCLAFIAMLDSSRRAQAAYILSATLAIYCGFVAALVIPAQLVALLRHRREKARMFVEALLACGLLCLPLIVLAVARGSGQLFWVPRPTLHGERQVLDLLTSAGLDPSFRATTTTTIALILTSALLVASAVTTALRRRQLGHTLVLAWLIIPVALAWLESLFGQPIFLPRNLLPVLPAVALLLALGLADRRLPPVATIALAAVLMGLRAVPLLDSYGVSPEDAKAATAYVLARTQPGDCIAFYPADARMPFAYYVRRDALTPRPILPAAPFGSLRPYVEDYATLTRPSAACPRLWLVSSHEGQPTGPAGSRRNYARYIALRSALSDAYPERQSARFGSAAVTHVTLFSRP